MKAIQLEQIAEQGNLVATEVDPDDRKIDQRAMYNDDHHLPLATQHEGFDVDHIHELQLGGSVDPSNLQLLNASVNRSIGAQIHSQIVKDGIGTEYKHVVIIEPPMGVTVPEGRAGGPE